MRASTSTVGSLPEKIPCQSGQPIWDSRGGGRSPLYVSGAIVCTLVVGDWDGAVGEAWRGMLIGGCSCGAGTSNFCCAQTAGAGDRVIPKVTASKCTSCLTRSTWVPNSPIVTACPGRPVPADPREHVAAAEVDRPTATQRRSVLDEHDLFAVSHPLQDLLRLNPDFRFGSPIPTPA
jgi:hypothetical protein